jgi:hypothetical protein
MCLLVVRKKDSSWLPSKAEFDRAWNINPDGFGIAYAHSGKVQIKKTLNKKSAWKVLQSIPAGAPALIHWRLATHGTVTAANCHPYPLPNLPDWCGAHNGVLGAQPCEAGLTDSESYLRTLKSIDVADIERDISRLGYGKMAFLSANGETVIANAAQGEWRGEYWQSNSNMEERLYSGFGYAGRSDWWRPQMRAESVVCAYCGQSSVSFRLARELYCADCIDWALEHEQSH